MQILNRILYFFPYIYVCLCDYFGSSLQHAESLISACKLLVVACGILVLQPGIKPRSLQWKHRVLITGAPGKSLDPALHINIFLIEVITTLIPIPQSNTVTIST